MKQTYHQKVLTSSIILVLILGLQTAFAQAPNISCGNQSQTFVVGTALTPLKPANTGGAVPATQYAQVSTLAGDTTDGYLNSTGTAARFNGIAGLVTDAAGNTYVCDGENQVIRKVTPAGVVSTFAGKVNQQGFQDGTGTAATFNYPNGITIDTLGNLYVVDYFNYAIRKITPAGVVTTFAGGSQGTADGQGTAASFGGLGLNITIDKFGNIYVIDYQYNGSYTENIVREITPGGYVSTYLNLGNYGITDPEGLAAHTVVYSSSPSETLLYISDQGQNKIFGINPSYTPLVIGSGNYGSSDGNTATANFNYPTALAFDKIGNLYIVDNEVLLREYSPSTGNVTTIAGNNSSSNADYKNGAVKNGIGTNATFGEIDCMAVDSKGNLYAEDGDGNSLIRKVLLTGYTVSPALPAGLSFASATGTISGTPTTISPASLYNVTAYNAQGQGSYRLGIKVVPPLTFGPLPSQVYGAADFSPGAVAVSGTITYTSSNTAVATIVSGNVHLTGVGTATITATNGTNLATQQLTVTKGMLTVTANNTFSVQGAQLPALTVSYSGFVNGDTQTAFTSQPVASTTATSTSAMGGYAITVSGGSSAKYNFNYVNGRITIVSTTYLQTSSTVNYGTADFYALGAATNGVSYSSSNTAVATIGASTGLMHLTGVGTTVIAFGSSKGQLHKSFTVNKGALTITANNQFGIQGTPLPVLTLSYTGFAKGDTSTGFTSQPIAATTATSTSSQGYYPITVSGGSSADYNFTYVKGTLTMTTEAYLQSTISKTYGAADFYTFGTSTSTITYTSSNTGVATISAAGLVHITGAGNTTITFGASKGHLTKTLTVATASLNIAANSQSKVTGNGNPPLTLTYTGLAYNETAANLTTAPIVSTTATTASVAGSYPITVSGAKSPNYNITYTPGTLTVTALKTGVPAISYVTPQTYTENVAATPLKPSSTGGTVPLGIYGTTNVFAGSPGTTGDQNGTLSAATFNNLAGAVVDKSGNIYVADYVNNNIRKISVSGIVSTFAGSGTAGSADGTGTAASFNGPGGIAADTAGNIYVADSYNGLVRKISPSGVVTTFAGANHDGHLSYPQAVAVDAAGNIYVVDYGNNNLCKFTPAGIQTTIAGGFYSPFGVAVNAAGTEILVSDFSGTIFKVTPAGAVTILAGSGSFGNGNGTGTSATFNNPNGLSIDQLGNVYVDDTSNGLVRVISPAGVVTTLAGSGAYVTQNGVGTKAGLSGPFYSAIDPQGKYLYVTSFSVLQKISLTGYSITPDLPQGLKLDSAGVISGTPVYASNAVNYKVTAYNNSGHAGATVNITVAGNDYKLLPPQISYPGAESYTKGSAITSLSPVNTGGAIPATQYAKVTTFAGNGSQGSLNGTGTQATFTFPNSIATDKMGNVYVAGESSSAIRKITPAGVVSNYAGTSENQGYYIGGMVIDTGENIYFTDSKYNLIRKITPAGQVSIVAGSGTAGYTDATGQFASFDTPVDLAIDKSGNLYVAELYNNVIRKITPTGAVTTYAGNGVKGYTDGPAAYASFNSPAGLAIDNAGNIYVGDIGNNVIRKISINGFVSTLAGNGTDGYTDGVNTSASFNFPSNITLDAAGALYVDDYQHNVIRKITPAGVVTTIAGSGTQGFTNGIGTDAAFFEPQGLAADSLGNLYVADDSNNAIRKILLTGYTIAPNLPAGLSFNPLNGVISGTPAAADSAESVNYTITAYNAVGSSSTAISITLVPAPSGGSVVKIQSLDEPVVNAALSPNGDGKNDVLTISNIEKYPQNQFMVMNAAGVKVYSKTGYDNQNKLFDGHSSINGALVPKGTYFYMLQYVSNGITNNKSGYIVIKY